MSHVTIAIPYVLEEAGSVVWLGLSSLAGGLPMDAQNGKGVLCGDHLDPRVGRQALKARDDRATTLVLHFALRQRAHARVSAPELTHCGQTQRQRPPLLEAGGELAALAPGVNTTSVRQRARRLPDSERGRRRAIS